MGSQLDLAQNVMNLPKLHICSKLFGTLHENFVPLFNRHQHVKSNGYVHIDPQKTTQLQHIFSIAVYNKAIKSSELEPEKQALLFFHFQLQYQFKKNLVLINNSKQFRIVLIS